MTTSIENLTGENGRTVSPAALRRWTAWLLISIAAAGLCLVTIALLWKVLESSGDHAGSSVFFAMTVAALGIWAAHWCGLILLNTLGQLQGPPRDNERRTV
jgi:hypothetical protein